MIQYKNYLGGLNMSDISSTSYDRDNNKCDNGFSPMLLILLLLCGGDNGFLGGCGGNGNCGLGCGTGGGLSGMLPLLLILLLSGGSF